MVVVSATLQVTLSWGLMLNSAGALKANLSVRSRRQVNQRKLVQIELKDRECGRFCGARSGVIRFLDHLAAVCSRADSRGQKTQRCTTQFLTECVWGSISQLSFTPRSLMYNISHHCNCFGGAAINQLATLFSKNSYFIIDSIVEIGGITVCSAQVVLVGKPHCTEPHHVIVVCISCEWVHQI